MITTKTMRRAGLAALLAATALAAGSLATIAGAQAPAPLQVDDFRLSDQNYLSRQLYRMSDAKAVVLIAYASGDKTMKAEAASYAALRDAYAVKGVETMLLASKLGETRERVNPEAKALGLSMPILFEIGRAHV